MSPALLLDVVLKLGIVLLLIYLSLRLLRRYGQQASSLPPGPLQSKVAALLGQSFGPLEAGELRVLQVQPLNRQLQLYLVAIGPRRLLLSVGLSEARLLSEWRDDEPPRAGAAAPVNNQPESEAMP